MQGRAFGVAESFGLHWWDSVQSNRTLIPKNYPFSFLGHTSCTHNNSVRTRKPLEALQRKLEASPSSQHGFRQKSSCFKIPENPQPRRCAPKTDPTDSSGCEAHCQQEKAFLANAFSMLGQCQGMVGKMKDPECLFFFFFVLFFFFGGVSYKQDDKVSCGKDGVLGPGHWA